MNALFPPLHLAAPPECLAIAVFMGLVVHQVFRRVEEYSFRVHAVLLFAPPTVSEYVYSFLMTSGLVCSPRRLVLSMVVYLTTLILSVVFYRLGPFHPLVEYPGPVLCKVSKFRMAFLSLSGQQHVYIKRLHDRYGDVVRIGPNELSIRDSSLIPPLLGSLGAPKGPHMYGRLLSDKAQMMVSIHDNDIHLQRRRSWNRGLTASAVKGYEQHIALRARQLVDRLETCRGEVVLGDWFNYFAYDFMSDMAFGGGSEMLSYPGCEKTTFWSSMEESKSLSTFLGHVPWLGVYLGHVPPVVAAVETLLDRCRELTQKRLERGSIAHDLFHYLNHEDTPEKTSPPLQQLVDDGILAMVAGADTVSSALTSVFCCLMDRPDVYKRLQAEIDAFYPPGEDVMNTKYYHEMHYLNAVINETLRLFPPIPGCTQRRIPRDGFTNGSIYIPPGTNVWVHAYSIHRDPRNFSPAPVAFLPERWLVAASQLPLPLSTPHAQLNADNFTHNAAAFIPFSHGPMNCVGKGLALQELRMVVCAVVQRFHVHPSTTRDGVKIGLGQYEREFKDYFVTARGNVSAVLEPRSASEF